MMSVPKWKLVQKMLIRPIITEAKYKFRVISGSWYYGYSGAVLINSVVSGMSSKIRHSTCLYVKEAGDNSPNATLTHTQTRSHSETTIVKAWAQQQIRHHAAIYFNEAPPQLCGIHHYHHQHPAPPWHQRMQMNDKCGTNQLTYTYIIMPFECKNVCSCMSSNMTAPPSLPLHLTPFEKSTEFIYKCFCLFCCCNFSLFILYVHE